MRVFSCFLPGLPAIALALALVASPQSAAQTIVADSDSEHTENGSLINDTAAVLKVGVGSEPFGNGRNAVINFKLPNLGAVNNPFTSAKLVVNLESLTSVDGFGFNVDLYAFPPRPGFDRPVLGTLVYYESDAEDPNLEMTLIQTDLITGGSGAVLGRYSTSAAGSNNLLNYLNAQYAGGSGIGEYVFFRLNPDADNGSVLESYNLTSADGANAANRPMITEGGTVVSTLGDKDGFGIGLTEGAQRSLGFFDARQREDPPFTDVLPVPLDEPGIPCTFSFSHSFDLNNEAVAAATLTFFMLGVQDGDSQVQGSDMELRLFLDGIEVAGAFDDVDQFLFDGMEFVEVAETVRFLIADERLTLLSDGVVEVRMESFDLLRDNACEGFAIDFSELVIQTRGAPPVPRIEVTPLTLDFGDVLIDSSTFLSVKTRNSGTAPLDVLFIDLGQETSADFVVTDFACVNLAPGDSVTTEVTYLPSGEGADTGTLVIVSGDASQPVVNVSLSGTGVAAPAPRIEVTPLALDFGAVVIGSSTSVSVETTNSGTAPLAVLFIDLGRETSTDFVVTSSDAPVNLPPGASVTTEVTYSPFDEAADTGTLVIVSDDADQPVVIVSLIGTGAPAPAPQIEVTPLALNFRNVLIDSSASLSVEITNSGTGPLDVLFINLGQETSTAFAVTGFDAPVILGPGASVTTEVTYSPFDERADTGTLVIGSDDADQPVVIVTLVGTGVASVIFRRGDADDSGSANITDAVGILNFLFGGASEPACLEAADIDNDGLVNISDPIGLLNFLFVGGAIPPEPPGSENCGPDPGGGATLDCTYESCA